jgi:hypothetical protein
MRDEGHEFTFKLWWERSESDAMPSARAPIGTSAGEALAGLARPSAEYEWTLAGAVGRAVHESGHDGSN